jgi:hemolysin activation/secretion protein
MFSRNVTPAGVGAIALLLSTSVAAMATQGSISLEEEAKAHEWEDDAGLYLAQQLSPLPPREALPPSQQQPEFELPPPLPPPAELLLPDQLIPETPTPVPGEVPETIEVECFEVLGSTVFTDEELAAVTAPYTNRPITFNELFEVRSQITALYANAGYITSSAIIPPQTLVEGVVTVQIIEGTLEDLVVKGTENLKPVYVSSRLAPYVEAPLNVNRLLEGLQLLQIDPLIRRVSSELAAGPRPGTSLLTVTVEENPRDSLALEVNNYRSPSVGTFQQIAEFRRDNLTGLGDRALIAFSNSEGSKSVQLGYRTFINPQNGSLQITAGGSVGEVVEDDFEILDINSQQAFVEATWRQPLRRTPNLEDAFGITYTWQQNSAGFLENLLGESVPFPSLGADDNGVGTVSALRFFYDYTAQSDLEVWALRSQVSIGLGGFLGGTVLDNAPDSSITGFFEPRPDNQFLAFRGQAQWARLLAPETLLIVRGELQLANDSLVPAEQLRLGGIYTVRGYRQDLLLTDNGIAATAEVRLPLYTDLVRQYRLQIAPFVDVGAGWNAKGPVPSDNVLAAVGAGLIWQQPSLTARVDWGIPLIGVEEFGDSLQENGVYFSVVFQPSF